MKKILFSAIAVVSLMAALIPASARAAATSSSFNVSVTLAAQCQATNSGSQTVDFGTYTAFGAAKTAAVSLTFNCTRGLATPTFTFDTANGNVNGDGVLAGLNYSLSTTTTPTTVTTGTAATAGSPGTAAVRTVTISGTMATSQAGQCSTASSVAAACDSSAVSHVRTLLVAY